ncbi:hypothetical protein Voc01_021040 [Virgisporangium ochraceum]|uniref:Uncharacterized protein n=1 Tax=Virgisporangium ochraceum TaxID=65505 RepID=A0A8J3ZN94_9ACTN|nr:hypothetical protein Voc01_021040 [Virgisporangium ochraceum]
MDRTLSSLRSWTNSFHSVTRMGSGTFCRLPDRERISVTQELSMRRRSAPRYPYGNVRVPTPPAPRRQAEPVSRNGCAADA